MPLASKLSVALHMGQPRGPAFLLFKWVANLAYLSVSSIISPSLEYLRGILTDFPLVLDNRCGGNRGLLRGPRQVRGAPVNYPITHHTE